jgi:hypothetical protein
MQMRAEAGLDAAQSAGQRSGKAFQDETGCKSIVELQAMQDPATYASSIP